MARPTCAFDAVFEVVVFVWVGLVLAGCEAVGVAVVADLGLLFTLRCADAGTILPHTKTIKSQKMIFFIIKGLKKCGNSETNSSMEPRFLKDRMMRMLFICPQLVLCALAWC